MDLLLYFDGMCEPKNPGGVAIGAYVLLEGEDILCRGGKVVADGGERATNNVAEWCALGFGLKAVQDWYQNERELHDIQGSEMSCNLLIRGDSKLVINQLTGEWQMKAAHLRPYRERCLSLLDEIGAEWEAEWVRRDLNAVADQVGREIYYHYGKMKRKETAQ